MSDNPAEGVKNVLTRQAGPLPVGGWILALGGGVAVAVFVRRRAAVDDPPETVAADATDGAADLPVARSTATPGTAGNLGITPGVDYDQGLGGESFASEPAETNAEWRVRAIAAVVRGGRDAGSADDAVDAYLAGVNPLSPARQAVINDAVRLAGPPPVGITKQPPNTGVKPTPVTPLKPTPVKAPAKPVTIYPSPAKRFKTNKEWQTAARALPGYSTAVKTQATRVYFRNTTTGRTVLSQTEAAFLSDAFRKLGQPPHPEPMPNVQNKPGPVNNGGRRDTGKAR